MASLNSIGQLFSAPIHHIYIISHSLYLCSHKLLSLSFDMSATGTKQFNANTRPVTSGKQSSVKGSYGKNSGCTTSCGLRLPRKTEVTAARLIKHFSCKFVKGLRLVVMRRKKKRSPPLKTPSTGRSQPSVISVANDTCRSEAIEDCIQFINSSTSFTRSSSASGRTS